MPHYVGGPFAIASIALLSTSAGTWAWSCRWGRWSARRRSSADRLDAAVAADTRTRAGYLQRLESLAGEDRLTSGEELAGEIERFLVGAESRGLATTPVRSRDADSLRSPPFEGVPRGSSIPGTRVAEAKSGQIPALSRNCRSAPPSGTSQAALRDAEAERPSWKGSTAAGAPIVPSTTLLREGRSALGARGRPGKELPMRRTRRRVVASCSARSHRIARRIGPDRAGGTAG